MFKVIKSLTELHAAIGKVITEKHIKGDGTMSLSLEQKNAVENAVSQWEVTITRIVKIVVEVKSTSSSGTSGEESSTTEKNSTSVNKSMLESNKENSGSMQENSNGVNESNEDSRNDVAMEAKEGNRVEDVKGGNEVC